GQRELDDLTAPGVVLPALQSAAHPGPVRLQHRDEPARPPLLADRTAPAPGLDPALDRDRPGRVGPAEVALVHDDTAFMRTPRQATAPAPRAARRWTAR